MTRKLFLLIITCLPTLSLAAPIASYSAFSEIAFSVSDSSLAVEVSSTEADSYVDTSGSSLASSSGSGDLGPVTPDTSFVWAATASGSVEPFAGMADSFTLTDGILSITNTSASVAEFSVDFTISLDVDIFTSDPADESLAYASAFIYDDFEDHFDEYFELDSDLGDSGTVGSTFSVSIDYELAAFSSVDIYLELDASGYASAYRDEPPAVVPAPATALLMLAGLAGLGAARKQQK